MNYYSYSLCVFNSSLYWFVGVHLGINPVGLNKSRCIYFDSYSLKTAIFNVASLIQGRLYMM